MREAYKLFPCPYCNCDAYVNDIGIENDLKTGKEEIISEVICLACKAKSPMKNKKRSIYEWNKIYILSKIANSFLEYKEAESEHDGIYTEMYYHACTKLKNLRSELKKNEKWR